MLHQSQRSMQMLSSAVLDRVSRSMQASSLAQSAAINRASALEQECAQLREAVAERDEAIVALATHDDELQARIKALEEALAQHAQVTRTMKDTLAEAIGSIRVIVRIRPMLPSDVSVDSRVGVTVRWLLTEFCKRVRAAAAARTPGSTSDNAHRSDAGDIPRVTLRQLVRLLGWTDEPEKLFRVIGFNPRNPEASAPLGSLTGSNNGGKQLLGIDVGPTVLCLGPSQDHMKEQLTICPELLDCDLFEPDNAASRVASGALHFSGGVSSSPLDAFLDRCASLAAREGTTQLFDKVHGPASTQEDVFADLKPLLDGALRGRSATVLAYGATGSGKSHTLLGSSAAASADASDAVSPAASTRANGLMMQGIAHLLQCLQREAVAASAGSGSGNGSGKGRRLVISCFELYNENCRDLLAGADFSGKPSAPARRGVAVADSAPAAPLKATTIPLQGAGASVVAVQVTTIEEAMRVLQPAFAARAQTATVLNSMSSRSHCIVRVALLGPVPAHLRLGTLGLGLLHRGVNVASASSGASSSAADANSSGEMMGSGSNTTLIHFCDLAGSEKVKESRAHGIALQEACSVNASLTCLSDVVTALMRGAQHIPYRNSKLTRILEPSLNGASRTLVLVTASCIPMHRESTAASLRFGATLAGTRVAKPHPEHVRVAVDTLLSHGVAVALSPLTPGLQYRTGGASSSSAI
jgi:hypothetical protein